MGKNRVKEIVKCDISPNITFNIGFYFAMLKFTHIQKKTGMGEKNPQVEYQQGGESKMAA